MKKFIFLTLSLGITFFIALNVSQAQQTPLFQYAVKVVCGKSDGKVVVPGTYLTAINVHNPDEKPVAFRKKFAMALPGQKPGPVSKFFKGKLGPDEALEIDCPDILELVGSRQEFFKGFVIIESPAELDVVAVYTAAGANGQVESLHMEPVSHRRLDGCPDLVVESIEKPMWDGANNRSVIRATIRNIGNASAGSTLARVIDPTTPQPTGAPYNSVAPTPALAPGATATVTFFLPYWVYNPDVTLEVTADYKNQLPECDDQNNARIFEDIG